jgi:hypothetical protein
MEADTCLEGAKTCHVNSQCVDFATGFCCECMDIGIHIHTGNKLYILGFKQFRPFP